jgi:predicted phosphoribosyltransferase
MEEFSRLTVLGEPTPFLNRHQAGLLLGQALGRGLDGPRPPVVIGLPRGGVVVAAAIARPLGGWLDILVPRKIGAPGQPELALGAVTERGRVFLNRSIVEALDVPDEYLEGEIERKRREIAERVHAYRAILPPAQLAGRTVILADDGVATGATMFAAIEAVRLEEPAELIVALPVGPAETLFDMSQSADRVLALAAPIGYFGGVSAYYVDFGQVQDGEVLAILREWSPAGDAD